MLLSALPLLAFSFEVARKELSSEVFCFISQLLLSLFSLIPGNAQEHLPDILQLLSHHSRLKGNLLNSVGSGGTSHNLQRLLKVKTKSDVWFLIRVCFMFTLGSLLSFFTYGRQEDTFSQIFTEFQKITRKCCLTEVSLSDFFFFNRSLLVLYW